jgi:hypothetical protein
VVDDAPGQAERAVMLPGRLHARLFTRILAALLAVVRRDGFRQLVAIVRDLVATRT